MDIMQSLTERIRGKNLSIVYPEGGDVRIIGAAARHAKDGLLKPVLIGDETAIEKLATDNGIDVSGVEIINPKTYPQFDEMVQSFVERRKGKVTEEQAREILLDETYFATMLVYLKKINGMVSGAAHSTADTIRPALQIVKTKPGVSRVSGAMILSKGTERMLFADIAVNITVDAQAMGEIAVESAKFAQLFDIDPYVALLSFSTKGSAVSPESEKVAEATRIAQSIAPNIPIDGELQFDAAIIESVGKQKAPGSNVAGKATVFIFPSLEAGNIGYKITQRLGGYEALGPLLTGLAAPINDLSRGCSEEDAYQVAIITAAQALMD